MTHKRVSQTRGKRAWVGGGGSIASGTAGPLPRLLLSPTRTFKLNLWTEWKTLQEGKRESTCVSYHMLVSLRGLQGGADPRIDYGPGVE